MARAWVGTSGYDYDHWEGILYPEDLPQRERFACYAEVFNSVELNNTFYGLPDATTVKKWRKQVEDVKDFQFVLKGSRYVTHMKHLKDPREHVPKLLKPASHLEDRLAGFLWQLPGGWKANVDRLDAFVEALVKESRGEDWWHAIEFRHASWFTEDVFDILRDGNVAVVHTDMPLQVLPPGTGKRDIPRPDVHAPFAADFVYLRKHGPEGDFGGGYTAGMVRTDAEHARKWLKKDMDVYAFYNNDPEGHAVRDAHRLARLLDATGPRAEETPLAA